MLNHLKFCKMFCDSYHKKYHSYLSDDIIADIVDVVLNRAPDNYFIYDMVQEHSELCKQCGMCCSNAICPLKCFNGKTCDEYAARPDACAEFPFYEINGYSGLILDPSCQFSVKLAEKVLDEEFKKNLDLLGIE